MKATKILMLIAAITASVAFCNAQNTAAVCHIFESLRHICKVLGKDI